ncbi:hypothetical protein [Streptomyces rimosus]|uniref:hypothetical protein n=1 Tax=Streptomyces rimosus TaxID=1927 RepID=UPI00067C4EB8|nr:hypothetical protein [Streptomyces rimosus]
MTLRLTGAAHRAFTGRPPAPADPFLAKIYSDMAELYGTAFDQERFEHAHRNTFTDMACGLLDALPPVPGPVGLIVAASAVPDFDPRVSAVSYLTDALPGTPQSFALSDQGDAAPYTALRLAGQYAADGQADRVLVMVFDQTTVPADPGPPRQGTDARDGAAALLLSAEGPGAPTGVRQYGGLTPEDAHVLLREALPGGAATLLLGGGLDPERVAVPAGVTVERAFAEFPCSGVWGLLADRLPHFAEQRLPVFLADYVPQGTGEEKAGELSFCVVDFSAATA